ncbi:MAG: oxidoreductase, partial [Actinomycetes bacterium]
MVNSGDTGANGSGGTGSNGPTKDPLEGELLDHLNQGSPDGRIVVAKWAGGIDQNMAKVPSIRVRKRWINLLWLIPIGVALGLIGVAAAQQLRTYPAMVDFLAKYPGTSSDFATPVTTGFPWWLRWQHFFNLIFMMFIIRAGLQILADHPRLYLNSGSRPGTEWLRMRGPVPADRMDPSKPTQVWTAKDDSVALPTWLGLPGFRHSIGLARWWHFSFDLLWVINGVVFFVLLFATGQWQRLVPTSWDVFPNALSTGIQYLSLDLPSTAQGFTNYNGLQLLAYFLTVFVAAPLAIVTGLLQAPAIAGKLGLGRGVLNRQVARTIHFSVLAWMVFFIAMHIAMVFITGLLGNLNHITLGTNTQSWWAMVLFIAWLIVLIGLWAWASPFTIRHPRKVQRAGEFLVGWIKGLMEWADPRATYQEKDISPFFWPNGELPNSPEYERLQSGGFADYRLRI